MTKKMMMAVACLSASTFRLFGQTMTETVHVNLPYATKIGNVSLPAGAYSIREVMGSVIEFSSDSRKGANTFVNVMPIMAPKGEVADHTKLVLKQDANGYQIQKIWLEGQDIGFELTTATE